METIEEFGIFCDTLLDLIVIEIEERQEKISVREHPKRRGVNPRTVISVKSKSEIIEEINTFYIENKEPLDQVITEVNESEKVFKVIEKDEDIVMLLYFLSLPQMKLFMDLQLRKIDPEDFDMERKDFINFYALHLIYINKLS